MKEQSNNLKQEILECSLVEKPNRCCLLPEKQKQENIADEAKYLSRNEISKQKQQKQKLQNAFSHSVNQDNFLSPS